MPDSEVPEAVRERLRTLEQGLAAVRERTHAQNNMAQIGMMTRRDETPQWVKTWGPIGAFVVALCTVGGIIVTLIWSASSAGTAITSRVAALEAWKVETVALPSRVQTLETGIETSRRIRDQQQQGTSDRLVSLERADNDARDRLNTVLQNLATITAQLQSQAARTEELLRRQDRLENRLGARPGSDTMEEQPTSLRIVPLVWRGNETQRGYP